MIAVHYTPSFIKQVQSLPADIQDEAFEKVDLFKERQNHLTLKVHKLNGRLAGRLSFSVNYRIRIIFTWINKDTALLHVIGDNDVYKD